MIKSKVFWTFLVFMFLGIGSFSFILKPSLVQKSKESNKKEVGLQEGDIIFQSSMSGQSHAIQLATKSKYSHCGILLKNKEGKLMVLEAIQPVKFTALSDFIVRGDNAEYVVKRLKNSDHFLTDSTLQKMKSIANEFLNKDYDLKFEWSDDKIYCSELVWKIYDRTLGIRLGEPQPLKSYSLENEIVKQKMEVRYGKNIPWEEPMVAPSTIFESEQLELVIEG